MEAVLEDATPLEMQQGAVLLGAAGDAMEDSDCRVQLCRFLPGELPALYAVSDEVQFLRQIQSSQGHTTGAFSDVLASLLMGVEDKPLARLYLNLNNPLICRLMELQDRQLLEQTVKILYVQALVAGGHPLQRGDMTDMNRVLLALLERII